MKYIDADLLRKEIKRLKDEYTDIAIDSQMGWVNANSVIDDLEQLQSQFDSLQQEQPEVDLHTEVEKYFQGLWPGMETAEQCNTDMHFTPPAIMRLASHFYELGKNSK